MKHILMVDDVAANLRCLEEILESRYQLSMAKSGAQAFRILKDTIPDLILLDINMPDMDGYEVLKRIKEQPPLAQIPVVFLTADAQRESEAKCFRLGAMDFIRKPFVPEILLSRITRILQIEDTRKELEIKASKDSLTGLWNRKYMEDFIETRSSAAYGEAEPEPDGADSFSGAFLLLDMDNFKEVNDNFGHIMGDAVLVKFARILLDFAEKKDSLCRIGGDEFAFFLTGIHEEEAIKETARKIIATIEYHLNDILDDDARLRVSASIGIARMPEDGTDFYTLYNKADKALYHVKQNGRRGYHIYMENEPDSESHAEEDTLIDLLQLQMVITESRREAGSYQVEFDGFKKIYQYVARCVERSGQQVQIVLFTVECKETQACGSTQLEQAMTRLELAVHESLRRGDVSTKYSNYQYVVILTNATADNAELVSQRIRRNWRRKFSNTVFSLRSDIQAVTTTQEDRKKK